MTGDDSPRGMALGLQRPAEWPKARGCAGREGAVVAATEIDELREQLARLEAENAALRDVTAPTTPIPPTAARRQREPGLWRAFASALCIVLATILVPISIVGAWARVQLVDEDAFVSTFAPLADDPDVQALIIDKTSTAISEAVDVQSTHRPGVRRLHVARPAAGSEVRPRAAASARGRRGGEPHRRRDHQGRGVGRVLGRVGEGAARQPQVVGRDRHQRRLGCRLDRRRGADRHRTRPDRRGCQDSAGRPWHRVREQHP